MKPKPDKRRDFIAFKLQQGDKKAFNALFRKILSNVMCIRPPVCGFGGCGGNCTGCDALAMGESWDITYWIITKPISSKMIYHRALNRIAQKEVKYRADTLFYEKSGDDLRWWLLSDRRINKTDSHSHSSVTGILSRSIYHHRFKDMSYKEIAELLNISTKTVDYRIQQIGTEITTQGTQGILIIGINFSGVVRTDER